MICNPKSMGPRFGSDKIKMRRLFSVWSRLGSSNTAQHPLSPTSDRRYFTLYNTRINDGARNMDAIYLVLRWVSQKYGLRNQVHCFKGVLVCLYGLPSISVLLGGMVRRPRHSHKGHWPGRQVYIKYPDRTSLV